MNWAGCCRKSKGLCRPKTCDRNHCNKTVVGNVADFSLKLCPIALIATGEVAVKEPIWTGNGVTEVGYHSSSSPPFTFPSSEDNRVPIYAGWIESYWKILWKSSVLNPGPSALVMSTLTTRPQQIHKLMHSERCELGIPCTHRILWINGLSLPYVSCTSKNVAESSRFGSVLA